MKSENLIFVSLYCLTAENGLDYHWDSCLKGYNQVNKVRVQLSYAKMITLLAHYKVYFVKQMGSE